jgi:type VI secretion system protein VasJ
VDADSANRAVGETALILTRAGSTLRAADATDSTAYRLVRAGMWLQVTQAPAAENGTTYIPAPPGHYKDHFEALAGAGEWSTLVTAVEELVADWPLWIDPHRYGAVALDNLGEAYANARLALLREVGLVLARVPELASLAFNDGTPFADDATKQWIEGDVKAVMGGGGGGGSGGAAVSKLDAKIAEAKALVANGALPDAVKLLMKAALAADKPADRFRSKLAIAQICIQAEQVLIARSALEGLDRLVEQHRLWEWEPALCSDFYSALYAAHRGMNAALGMEVPVEARARETAVFERLCQVDAAAALKFTLGG